MNAWRGAQVVAAIVWASSSCAMPQAHVLCTTTLVADVVRAVAGPEVSVVALLPPGADPHAFQPAPGDARAIVDADLVFLSGAGLEATLAPILAAARGPVIDLSARVALQADHGAVDPHVWFDPENVAEWVRAIEPALAAADPSRASQFRDRAAAYQAELVALDAWIRETVSPLAPERRRLVTDHEVLGYFASRYGFLEIGTVFPGTSTLSEPSARDLVRLEDAIRAAGVRAVFVGTTVSPALAEQVAADTGAQVVFLYTGSLSDAGGPAATYLDLMRFDVRHIVDALAPEGP